MDREDLPNLMAFAVIVEEGGFRSAAAKLNISSSALSHSLRKLESKIGVPLLRRTTRSISLTEAGADLLRRLRPAFEEIDSGLEELAGRRDRIVGTVRINAHRNALLMLILPKLRSLKERYPDLKLEIVVDDGLSDIVATGCDIGVRTGKLLAKDMIAVRISNDYRTAIIAARSYLETNSPPQKPEDLDGHSCIGYRLVTTGVLAPWRLSNEGHTITVAIEPNLILNDMDMAVRAAAYGLGLAYVHRDAVADRIAAGEFVEVLQDWACEISADYLYYPSRRTVSPGMRAVIDHLRQVENL
ncbi:LysR family transcriptional regulator (plasmid) [Sphingobium sp. SJ10-10]|uniref:LysR family transcriptional regulator n=1 Tax=Sphingobium sp. SJ10-10 TaxID=3114999 RepID=UPI002E183FC4|nr:LysR family transcriptional regulator [Sphingobium sp. SJ10-10]